MKWIRTKSGDKAHAVFKHRQKTLCGIDLDTHKGLDIIYPHPNDRCGRCEMEWEERGRALKPKVERIKSPTEYEPQFTYRDWEEL
jgi:hypothetical protein